VSILWAVAENLSENDSNLLKNDMSPKPPQIGKFAVALALAFMRDDTKEMEGLVSAAISSPESQDIIFASQSDTEAFHGHLRNARDFLLKAVNSWGAAIHSGKSCRAKPSTWERYSSNSPR
jgi:hypothetical protein